MATDVRAADAIEYPTSDGKPMAETDTHIELVIDARLRLKARYAGRKDVYVAGNLFVYYEEGNPHKVLAPDCFVAFGVPPGSRDTFKTWEEGAVPSVVFEFTSKTTQREDMDAKFGVYDKVWRVDEYFLFDPYEEYLEPSLLGYRRSRGELKPIKPVKEVLTSKVLGITLARDGTRLVLRDAATGKLLPTAEGRNTERAERAAKKAETRAASAEAEVARLKAELEALRRKPAE